MPPSQCMSLSSTSVVNRVRRHGVPELFGQIEHIEVGDRLNIWVKWDNESTCNYSARELEHVPRFCRPDPLLPVRLLLDALDATAGPRGSGGPADNALRRLAAQLRERSGT